MTAQYDRSEEPIFVRVLNFDNPEEPLFFIDDYGFHEKITSWNDAKKLIERLNKFYSTYSKEDVEKFQKENAQYKKEQVKIRWEQEFGEIYTEEKIYNPINGFIYFLQAENDIVKIGKTINLKNRFDQIQPQLPFKTKIMYVLKTPDYTLLEKKFHELFDDKQVNGEWFKLTDIDIENIKCRILPQDILDLIIEEN
jgi:hypothetical protein